MVKQPTWNDWSKANEATYSMLFSYLKTKLKDIDEFTFITDNKRAIMGLIEGNPSWKLTTMEGLLFMVAKFLKLKKDFRYAKLYSQKAYEYMIRNREAESHNKQDEKEIKNYRDRQFFINVLDTIDYDSISTVVGHYKYLLLALLTFQPPVRTSFYTSCKFIVRQKDNNKIDNFIRINKRKPVSVSYIINNDKVSKSKIYSMNKKLSIINLIDPKLINLVVDSYTKYPRTYLFELNEKPISQPTLLDWLRDITKVDGINIDMCRSSYINWFYEHNKSTGKREQLASMMRHSSLTAQRNYLKIISDAEPAETLPNKIIELQTEVNKLKTNCTEDLGDLVYRKRKRDAIRTMNAGGVPRASTLAKYGITYDDVLKLYK